MKARLKLKSLELANNFSGTHPKKRVIIECYGGLGNQLLAMFIGLYCSQKYDRLLHVDYLYLDSKRSSGFDFTVFDWGEGIEVLNNPLKQVRNLSGVYLTL